MSQDMTSQSSYWDRVAQEKRFSHPLRLDWLEKYSTSRLAFLITLWLWPHARRTL